VTVAPNPVSLLQSGGVHIRPHMTPFRHQLEWRRHRSRFCFLRLLRKKHQRLAMQARKSYRGAETLTAIGIERDDLVLRDAVEMAIRPKAQAAGPAKLDRSARGEDANEVPASDIVFPHGSHRIGRAEGALACHDDVSVGRDRQIKRAELGVADEPNRPYALICANARTELSPTPFGPIPEARKNLPS
jgi:hypothetical protein